MNERTIAVTTKADDDLLALAERCEAATGPDRELDYAILCAAHPICKGSPHKHCDPAFTASLDAAMTLVPEGYGWRLWVPNSDVRMLDGFPNLPRVTMWGNRRSYAPYDTPAATPALALCAASLRAMASKEDNGGE